MLLQVLTIPEKIIEIRSSFLVLENEILHLIPLKQKVSLRTCRGW